MPAKILKNDTVVVVTGESGGTTSSGPNAGRRGRVLTVMKDQGRVMVEGANLITKHIRRSTEHPQGARLQKEAAIDISNVRLVCPACDRGVSVRFKKDEEGDWTRVCKRCGAEIPVTR